MISLVILAHKDLWLFVNSFAPWLSALGTIAAVIISLYFSRKSKKIDISLSSSIMITFNNDKKERFFTIYITNVGFRSVTITGIGCEYGFFKSKTIIGFTPNNLDKLGLSSKFPPIKLSDGDQIGYFIPIDLFLQVIKIPSSKIKKHLFLNSIQVTTSTSTGKTIKNKISKIIKKDIDNQSVNK